MHTCPAQALVYALRRRPSAGFSLACAPHPVCHFGIWHACVRGRCALAHACSVLYAHVTSVGTLLWYARYTGQGRRSCARRAEHVGPSVVAWCSTLDRTGNTTQEYTKAGYFAHHRAYTSQLSNLAVIPSSPLPPTPHHSRSRFQVDDKRRIFLFPFSTTFTCRSAPNWSHDGYRVFHCFATGAHATLRLSFTGADRHREVFPDIRLPGAFFITHSLTKAHWARLDSSQTEEAFVSYQPLSDQYYSRQIHIYSS